MSPFGIVWRWMERRARRRAGRRAGRKTAEQLELKPASSHHW